MSTLGIAGTVSAVLFAPLGLYFLRHPWLFSGHASDVSLAAVAARDFDGSLGRALWAQITAVAGMFFVAGDPSTFHGLPGLPVYDPITALWAVIGLAILVKTVVPRRADPAKPRPWLELSPDAAALLLLWALVGLLPTLLSDRPPNFSRAIGALPVLMTLPAIGLCRFATRWGIPVIARRLPEAAMAWAGVWAIYQTFVVFPALPQLADSYDQDKVEIVAALAALPTDADRFLAPVWAEQATVDYLLNYTRPLLGGRDGSGGEVLDLADSDDWTPEQWQAWADGGEDGQSVVGVVVEAGDTDGRVGEPALRGLDWRRSLVLPGDGRDVLLAWPADEAERDDVMPAFDRLVGGLAPWNEIRVSVAQGDSLVLPSDDVSRICGDDLQGGELRMVDGEAVRGPISGLPGLQRRMGLELACLPDARGRMRLLVLGVSGTMAGDMAPPRDALLEPEIFVAARFGGAIDLVGYTVGDAPRAGDAVPITLVWRTVEPLDRDWTTFVHLVAADGTTWGQQDGEPGGGTYPTTRWRTGDIVIDRFTPVVDADASDADADAEGRADQLRGLRPVIGWYDRTTGERMRVGEQDALPLRELWSSVPLPSGGDDETP